MRALLFLSIAIIVLVFSPVMSASAQDGLTAAQLRVVDNGIRSAFAIPSGYGVTPNIRSPLQQIYNTYEPTLRQKLIAIQTVTDPDHKKQLVQEITQIRSQIKSQAMPIFQAEKMRIYREMEAKRQKQLAEMRKKAQQRNKNKNKNKNKNRRRR